MDRTLYQTLSRRAADLVEAGDRQQAIVILEELVQSDLPALDQAIMCMNIAIIQDQLGNSKLALQTYARAVDIERTTESCFVEQSKAAYLARIGNYTESIQAYEDLLRHEHVNDKDREMFFTNINTLSRLQNKTA